MKEGQTVGRLLVKMKGKINEIIIRYPKESDFDKVWKFDNKVIKETKFLDTIKPINKRDEKSWFLDMLEGIRKKNYVYLLAEHKGVVVGACTVRRQKQETYLHVGVYDIVVEKNYWRLGIGEMLTKNVIAIAKNGLGLKILRLILYSGNKSAEELYKKFGFRVAGRIPNGVIHGTKCMDEIIFYKVLK